MNRRLEHKRALVTGGSCNAERMPFAGGSVYAMSKSPLVAYLVSPESAYVTGVSLSIDGGFTA